MKLVNCMKHAATLLLANGEEFILEPSGNVATCFESPVQAGEDFIIGESSIKTSSAPVMGDLNGLPEPQEGVVYYVNMLSFKKAVAAGRKDVCMGDSGSSAIRDDKGMVKAITVLIFP